MCPHCVITKFHKKKKKKCIHLEKIIWPNATYFMIAYVTIVDTIRSLFCDSVPFDKIFVRRKCKSYDDVRRRLRAFSQVQSIALRRPYATSAYLADVSPAMSFFLIFNQLYILQRYNSLQFNKCK